MAPLLNFCRHSKLHELARPLGKTGRLEPRNQNLADRPAKFRIDGIFIVLEVECMKTSGSTSPGRSRKARPREVPEQATPGTVIAAQIRAQANTYTDEQRSALLDQGMALIYGGPDRPKSAAHRR